jgi:hypothetical protein
VKTISLKKRIALVAVAALGSTLVASAPAANAGTTLVSDVAAINLTRQTSSPVVGGSVKVNVGITTTLNTASTTIPLTAVLTKYPSAGFVQTTASLALGGGSAAVYTGLGINAGSASISGAVLTLGSSAPGSGGGITAGSVASSSTNGVGSFSFTPSVAGDYELTVWHDVGVNTSVVDTNESRQTISITVVAAPVAAGGASLMTWAYGDVSAPAITATAEDLVPSVSSLTGAVQSAVAIVNVKGSTGSALNGATLTASISGAGLVLADTDPAAKTGTARSSSAVLAADVGYVHVSADGSSGKGTVTVSVTDPVTAATSTIGTFTVQFYSSTVATLTATQNYSVLGAARVTGCSSIACQGATYSAGSNGKAAVVIVAKDSAGNVIPGLTLTATSSDATVISTSTVTAVTVGGAIGLDATGLGAYNASVTGASSAVSGKTATVTYSYTNTSGAKEKISSAAVPFTIGGTTIVTETLAFDKTSYVAGEAMVVTRTAKDSAGNSVADGVASPAVTFSKPVGGTAPAAGHYVKGVSATSATTPTVFAPASGGAFTAQMTGGDAAATKYTASSSVVDGNAALLTQIDALNAKIVALNALIAKIMKKLGVK